MNAGAEERTALRTLLAEAKDLATPEEFGVPFAPLHWRLVENVDRQSTPCT